MCSVVVCFWSVDLYIFDGKLQRFSLRAYCANSRLMGLIALTPEEENEKNNGVVQPTLHRISAVTIILTPLWCCVPA